MSNIELLTSFKRKEHTHRLVIDMLTKDLKIKTVEMLFNALEQWSESHIGAGNIGGLLLAEVSPMLCNDTETIAWKATAYDLKTGLIVINWQPKRNPNSKLKLYMKTITPPQLSKLHVLLNNNGMLSEKRDIIRKVSDGRTESSKELSYDEAKYLIGVLVEYDPKERQKSLIFSLAYRAGIIYGSTGEDKKINAAKLNLFLKERGAVKKELNTMDISELIKIHRQFEAIVKNNDKSKQNKEAKKVVSNMLDELGLTVN